MIVIIYGTFLYRNCLDFFFPCFRKKSALSEEKGRLSFLLFLWNLDQIFFIRTAA